MAERLVSYTGTINALRNAIECEPGKIMLKLPLKVRDEIVTALEELNKRIPAQPEVEGNDLRWWYVCGECHGYINEPDGYCRHCGRVIRGWDDARFFRKGD